VHWFYDPSITEASSVITATELEHFKSLRIRDGEEIAITNGVGGVLTATVSNAAAGQLGPKSFQVTTRSTPAIHLVQSLAKGGRDEAALQTAVELGVSSITPLQASRSVVEWGAKASRNQERWNQIAISAMKQSQQAFRADIKDLSTLKQLIPTGTGLVLDPQASTSIVGLELENEVTIVVGPEGGFSQQEIDNLSSQGFLGVRLGGTILRTSSAGPAAIAALMALSGQWS
jgi:16S rRNA (uracil1498-N3)-methyltransferase